MDKQSDLDDLWAEHRELRQDFYMHEAVVEERWKTIFNEMREYQKTSRQTNEDLKARIESLYKLVLTVSGSAIIVLGGALMTEILR